MESIFRNSLCRLLPVLLVVGGLADSATAATLKGKFVLNGVVPVPAPIVDRRAVREFPNAKLVEEGLLVDLQNLGIANIVVYVRSDAVKPTAEAAEAAPTFVTIDAATGQFRPRIVGLWHGEQTLVFQTGRQVADDFNFPYAGANPLLPPSTQVAIPVPGTKLIPQEAGSQIHPWMKAYVVIKAHPYVAATAADGSFVIEHLPEGVELEFQVWHECSGYLEVAGWGKGRFTKTLAPGETELGTIQVPRGLFK